VHKIEWIEDYRTVADGMGGTREDSGLQSINAKIRVALWERSHNTADVPVELAPLPRAWRSVAARPE